MSFPHVPLVRDAVHGIFSGNPHKIIQKKIWIPAFAGMTKLFCLFSLLILFFSQPTFSQRTEYNTDFKLALNLFNDKLYDLALEQFKDFVVKYPGSQQTVDARYYIALTQKELQKNDDARIAFQNFALTYPEHAKAPEAWWNVGEIFFEQKNYAEAASAFERIKIFHPKNPLAAKALLQASINFEKANDKENAKKTLKSLFAEYPAYENVPHAHLRLGTLYLQEEKFDLAKNEFLAAKEQGKNSEIETQSLLQLGILSERFGKLFEAEQYYRSIINNKKTSSSLKRETQLQLSQLLLSVGNDNDAEKLLNDVIIDSSKLSVQIQQRVFFELGNLAFKKQELKKSISFFEKSLNNPIDTTLYIKTLLHSAETYFLLQKKEQAVNIYQILASLPQNFPNKEKGLLLAAELSIPEKSVTYYSQYLLLYPNSKEYPVVLWKLAKLYEQIQNPQKAKELYQEFLTKYSHHKNIDDVLFGFAFSNETTKNFIDANHYYDEILTKFSSSEYYDKAQAQKKNLRATSSTKETSIEQLASLLGDIILEKPKDELAMRLGDLYADVFHDNEKALLQYEKVESVTTNEILKEEAAYKKTHLQKNASTFNESLQNFLQQYPNGKFSEQVRYDIVQTFLSTQNSTKQIQTAKKFLEENPNTSFTPNVQYQLAMILEQQGNFAEAIQYYTSLPTQHSLYNDAQARLGLLLARQNDTSAQTVLQNYLKQNSNGKFSAKILFALGKFYLEKNNLEIARATFEQLRTQYFYTDEAEQSLPYLITIEGKNKNYNNAIVLYEQELQQKQLWSPQPIRESVPLYYSLASLYENIHDTLNAKKYYREYLNYSTDKEKIADAYFQLGIFEHPPESAIRYIEKSVEYNRNEKNTLVLSSLYFSNEKFNDAVEEYSKLLSLTKSDSLIMMSKKNIIIALFRVENLKEAEEKIAEFKKKYEDETTSLAEFDFEKAMYFFKKQQYQNAFSLLRTFSKRYKETPFVEQSYFWLGKIYETENKLDSALVMYQTLQKNYPQTLLLPKLYLAFGNIYFAKENYDEAVKYYRLIVDKPNFTSEVLPFAMSNLIQAYNQVNLYDGALELTRTFIERFPNDETIPEKKIGLGILYQKLSYYDQAIAQLQSLLETTNPNLEAEIRYYLGETYFYKGEFQQAVLEFLKVPYLITQKTKLDWTPNAYYMAGQSYEKLGKYEQALNMYQQIIAKPGIDPTFKSAAEKEINRVKNAVSTK